MSSALLDQHPSPARQMRAAPAPRMRLSGTQLREVSAQWRQRAGEDGEKAQRIADILEWVAAQRDAQSRTPSLLDRLRASVAGWMRS